jgi:hypothetical protein
MLIEQIFFDRKAAQLGVYFPVYVIDVEWENLGLL